MMEQFRIFSFATKCINLGFSFSSDFTERSVGRSNVIDLLKYSSAIVFPFVVVPWNWTAVGIVRATIDDGLEEFCRGSSNGF